MTMMQMYLLTRMDYVQAAFLVGAIVSATIGWIMCIRIFNEEWEHRFTFLVAHASTVVILTALYVLTPSTKEVCFIWLAPKIVNNEFVKELPADLADVKDLAMQYIRENLGEEKNP